MPPRHFWWLVAARRPAKRKISDEDRREFKGWLMGKE
jgi:hypothetical protein